MMRSRAWQRSVALLVTPLFLNLAVAGCMGTVDDGSEADDTIGLVRIQVQSTDGLRDEHAGSFEEVVAPLLTGVPDFTADGQVTTEASSVLNALRSELTTPDGKRVVLDRYGRSLRRTEPAPRADDTAAFEVQWDDGLGTLVILRPDRTLTVTVTGITDAMARATYMSRLALAALAGEEWVLVSGGRQAQALPVAIKIVIIVIGGCIALHITCGVMAKWHCGKRGVRYFHASCLAAIKGKAKGVCTFRCR